MARPRDIDGSFSSDGGSRGTSPRVSARFSTAQVTAPNTIARAISAQVHHGQPSEWPSVSGTSRATSVAANSTVPDTSTPTGCGERVLGTIRDAISSTTMPIGTLTRKIGRQDVPAMFALTSSPPTI